MKFEKMFLAGILSFASLNLGVTTVNADDSYMHKNIEVKKEQFDYSKIEDKADALITNAYYFNDEYALVYQSKDGLDAITISFNKYSDKTETIFTIEGFFYDMVELEDSYIVSFNDSTNLFFLKISKGGDIKWTKRIDVPNGISRYIQKMEYVNDALICITVDNTALAVSKEGEYLWSINSFADVYIDVITDVVDTGSDYLFVVNSIDGSAYMINVSYSGIQTNIKKLSEDIYIEGIIETDNKNEYLGFGGGGLLLFDSTGAITDTKLMLTEFYSSCALSKNKLFMCVGSKLNIPTTGGKFKVLALDTIAELAFFNHDLNKVKSYNFDITKLSVMSDSVFDIALGKLFDNGDFISMGVVVKKETNDEMIVTFRVNLNEVDAVDAIEKAKKNPTVENLSLARTLVNNLDESIKKDELQDALNNTSASIDMTMDRKTATANMDINIKSDNMLSLSLDTNSITFEDFSGVEDMEKQNAVNLVVSSSLPYKVNAYLAGEIQNSDKSKTMDKSILNIKANSEVLYQTFNDTVNPIILLDNQIKGNDIPHSIDLKLKGNIAHKKDVYKTTIKFEVEQK